MSKVINKVPVLGNINLMRPKQQQVLLSPYHQIFYNEQQLDPKRFDYNIAFVQRITGFLDVDRLNHAIRLFTSNTYLYRCIVKEEPEYCFWEDSGLPTLLESFAIYTEEDVQAYIKKEFQLNENPGCRFALFANHPTDHVFVAVIHHILIDGLKFDEFIITLGELYNNPESTKFQSLNIQKQALINENINFKKRIQEEERLSLKFWANRLHNLPKGEKLLGDTPGNNVYKVSALDFTLPKVEYYCWKSNLKNKISDFNTILAVFGIILRKYNRDSEIPITYPIAIKKTDDLKFGSTINTVITRVNIDKGMTFEDLVCLKKIDIKDEKIHSSLPIYVTTKLMPGVKLNIGIAQTCLKKKLLVLNRCRTMLMHANYCHDIAGNDIVLECDFSNNDEIFFRIKYREKFSSIFIEALSHHLLRVLKICLGSPKLEIMNIPLLSAEEHRELTTKFNPPPYLFPKQDTVHRAFEKIVMTMPDKIGCIFGSTQLTYRELNTKGNQIANYLIQLIKKQNILSEIQGLVIGICIKRSANMIIGMLGILKTDSAYLPIDPEYPEERIKLILTNANCKIILADNESYKNLAGLFNNISIINLETDIKIYKFPGKNLPSKGTRRDLVHVIYTSGTTGIPKGVLLKHAGIIRLVKNNGPLQITENDCVLQASSVSFDAATFEIWGSLLNGATLDLLETKTTIGDAVLFKEYLRKKKINVLWLTVGVFNQLARQDNTIFSALKYLVIGGDVLSKQLINDLVSLPATLKPMNIINGYGPTENTVFTTLYPIEKPIKSLTSIPIGSALPGTICYILDGGLRPVPIGVVGELYIGGQGLAHGYLNRPELTQECFIQNPFFEEKIDVLENKILYKTGDLARWLTDGNIEFIGRRDNQVKIRGFRVELREIESYLMRLSVIRECVVMVSSAMDREMEGLNSESTKNCDKYIIAYYTLKDLQTITKQEIREFLLKHLPPFMMPTYILQLDKMPLTVNGKLDLNLLPLPTIEPKLLSAFNSPANEFELIIKKIWQEVLEINEISTLSCILDLGTHSLHLLRIAAKIQKYFEVNCSVKMILDAQTVKKLAETIKLQLKANEDIYAHVSSATGKSNYPLSFEQSRLWFLSKYTEVNFIYNILSIFKIRGELNLTILEHALLFLVNRHSSLKTNFREDLDGNPYQIVGDYAYKAALVVQQNEILESDLESIFLNESSFEFNLKNDCLFKFNIYRLAAKAEYIFIANMHHIISDEWSLKIFFNELGIVYNAFILGEKPKLPAIEIQYGDYAIWQKNILYKRWSSQLEYWRKKLSGYENISLPIKGERPPIKTYSGSHLHFELDPSLVEGIDKFVSKHGCTLHMFLLTVFYLLLKTYTGHNNFIIGIPVTNRGYYQFQNIIGFFVNLLPIRITDHGGTKESLLQEVKVTCIEAYNNQDISFDNLVNELQLNRDQSISPLFQVMFNLIHESDTTFSIDNAVVDRIQFDPSISKFDLTLSIHQSSKKIAGNIEFNTDLFDPNLAQAMTVHYSKIIEDFLKCSDEAFCEINMLPESELNKIFDEWNNTASYYDKTLTVANLFEANVLRAPDAVAVKFNDLYLTYSQLNNKANQLCNYMRRKYFEQYNCELPPDSLVAIYMERSVELAIAILAVVKSGCGFVPIDVEYPEDRVSFILKDTKAEFIITNNFYAVKLKNAVNDIDNDIMISVEINIFNNSDQNYSSRTSCKPNNLAYVIYTSGSTGKPKGVCISHLSLNNLITSFSHKIPLRPNKKFLSLTSYVFDIFYLEFFGALCFGAEVILTDNELIKDPVRLSAFINTNDPDIIQATPSLWQLIVEQLERSPKLNILCGGEVLYPTLVEKLFCVANDVWNLYGPTESTIWSTSKKLTINQKISIGTPISNTIILILNNNLQPVPIGIEGEIYIAGDGLAREYLNNTELTKAQFINTSFKITVGRYANCNLRLYKTGDRGRWLENGEIEILGRVDFQVKVRGHRIEPAEIEEYLLIQEGVSQCAVVSKDAKMLVAYYISSSLVEPMKLKESLAKILPSYLVPDMFVPLTEMPLTRNGKVDRNALSKRNIQPNFVSRKIRPQTDVEAILADIYRGLLNLNEVSVYDNFFDIGGHSVNAIQLLTRINKTFDINLTLKSIFDYGRIIDLSKHIESLKNVEVF